MHIIVQIFIMFIITIGLMRLMGKSSIVQLTPYDLVAIFIIGSLVAEPFVSTNFKVTIVRSIIVVVFYLLFARLTLNQAMNKFLLGEPSLLIKHGKIVEQNLEKEHISLIQLLSFLRAAGYSKLTDVNFAILEPTGSISVIPVSDARPVTLYDLNIEGKYEGIPIAVIIDGKIQKRNLKIINQSEEWLKNKLKEKGIKNINQIIYAFADDQSDDVHVNLREDILKQHSDPGRENNQNTTGDVSQKRYKEIDIIRDSKILAEGLKKTKINMNDIKSIFDLNNFKEVKKLTVHQEIILHRKEYPDK